MISIMHQLTKCLPVILLPLLALGIEPASNFCPNPDAESVLTNGVPAGWLPGSHHATLDATEAHSGEHCLKISSSAPGKYNWTSDPIPVPISDMQFSLSLWARTDRVTGGNGAHMALHHFDADGKRTGSSGGLSLAGAGDDVATTGWKQYMSTSELTPDVKAVKINLRLYRAKGTVWFDDISLYARRDNDISAPRPLRRGLRLEPDRLAICSARGADGPAQRLQAAFKARGVEVPVLAHDEVAPADEKRDLIVLGNLATSKAVEWLYVRYYTYADLYFPGKGGHVLRPLINPLGTGVNMLVVGASDAVGLSDGVDELVRQIAGAEDTLDVKLAVQTGPDYLGNRNFPWPAWGPYREMKPAGAYLKSGDLTHAQAYRDYILKDWFTHTDKSMAEGASKDSELHMLYHSMTMSWDLTESSGVFSDEERLKLTRQLLRIMRSPQGVGYNGFTDDMRTHGNHDVRSVRSFYFGYRYFDKYYHDELATELRMWREKLEPFWAACFSGFRAHDEGLSSHSFGASLNCTLDVAMMEPTWSKDFIDDGLARMMGERCIAVCNNMGELPFLGDAGLSDYPSAEFAKLTYLLGDGRYQFMIDKRGATRIDSDEAMRAFLVGVPPVVPRAHLGLTVIPADPLFFTTALRNPGEVPLEKGFDKITFRSGFDPADEYLLLEGVAGTSHAYDDANSIVEFSANSRRWLCELDRFNGPTMGFHNAVTVARNGMGMPKVPDATELAGQAAGDGYAYTATRLPHYNGVAWTRHILWLPHRYTMVFDELVAEEKDDYAFVLGWRSLGRPELRRGWFEAAQDEPWHPDSFLDGKALADAVTLTSGKAPAHKSNGNLLVYRDSGPGDFLEITIPIPEDGEYDVVLTTLATSVGWILQPSIDGEATVAPIDTYAPEQGRTDTRLARMHLNNGPHTLRVAVTGKNPESKGGYLAIAGLSLYTAVERQHPREPISNRFRLLFPSDTPATLERNKDTLGRFLPERPYRDQAINVVEQSMNRIMEPGDSVCFQNVFYAARGEPLRDVQYRSLNKNCALIKTGEGIALVGAGVEAARITLGPLEVSGKMFHVSATRVILHDAAATLDGRALQSDTEALSPILEAAWEEARSVSSAQTNPWQDLPRLKQRLAMDLPGAPLIVEACRGDAGLRLAVGMENGTVGQWDLAGVTTGAFTAGGPVHALDACDLDGDGTQELIVGSDDERVHALDPAMNELWQYKVPFLAKRYLFWSLYKARARAIHCDDIDGDGSPEILVGAGDMNVHCLDAAGRSLWNFHSPYGIPTTILTTDVYGDGELRVVVGNGLMTYTERCWVLDGAGQLIDAYYGDVRGTPVIAVADLDRDGTNTFFSGNLRGRLHAWAARREPTTATRRRRKPRWKHTLPKPIRSLTVLPGDKQDLLAVCSDSGYLSAFNEAGEKAWGLPLSSGISRSSLVRCAGSQPLLAAGCLDGGVFLLTCEGKLCAYFDAEGQLRDMIVTDLDGDGSDELVIVTAGSDRLQVVETGLKTQ